jgi:hypothetical protein
MGSVENRLTMFQRECERELMERIGAYGYELRNRRLSGEAEIFIEGEVDGLQVWIYEDEACIIGRGTERVFEKWDFDTQHDLIAAFIEKVVSALTGK